MFVIGDRDLALDSAERIQKAYEGFQQHVHDRMLVAQQQIDSTVKDRDKLRSELTTSQAELKELHEKMHQLTKDCSTVRDAREQLEQLNANIQAELKCSVVRVAELETKLLTCESLERENKNLKLTVEQQRVRLEHCQADIGESRAQLGQLEDLAQRLQRNMTAVHGSQKMSSSCLHLSSLSVKDDANDISSLSASAGPLTKLSGMKAKVAVLESELQQARKEAEVTKGDLESERMEVRRLKAAVDSGTEQATGAVAEMAEIGAKSVIELELSLARLEDERENHLSTIRTLESRISDLEARKAAADAELAQRGQQLEVTRRELTDRGAKEAALSREVRKQALQIAGLEHQLDEKVSEIATQVKRSATLSDEVHSLSSEISRAHEERDEQSRIAVENASACAEMRQLHDAQCHQLEASVASLNEQHHVMDAALSKSDAQIAELLRNLTEMTEQANALRQELSRRGQDEQMSEVLEQRAVQAEDLVLHLETELQCCQTECNQLRTRCDEADSELNSARLHISQLNEMLKDASLLEAQLRTDIGEQKSQVRELQESSEHDRRQLQDLETKSTELEVKQVCLLSQIAQSEHALQCRAAEYKSEIEALQKKLDSACSELEQRSDEVHELGSALRSAQLERSRIVEDLGGQLKSCRKQLKQQDKDLRAEISQLKAELDLSVATLEEKDARVKNLSGHLAKVEASLQSVSEERTKLLSELEQLRQTAGAELTQKMDECNQEVTALKAEVEIVRANLRRCEDAFRSKEKEVESLTSLLQVRHAYTK